MNGHPVPTLLTHEERSNERAEKITVAAPFSSSGTVATVAVDAVPAAAATVAALAFPPLLFWTRSVLSAAEEEAGMTWKTAAAEGPADLYNSFTQSKESTAHARKEIVKRRHIYVKLLITSNKWRTI